MPSNPDATVQRLWQLTKQTNSGTVLTVDAVIQGLSTAFAKTDIAATKTDENRLLLARSGSAITNKVAFNGELTVVDSDERIIVKLTGNKNATAAAAGSLLDVCASIAVCPPLLCCTGVNAVDEANYVEKNTEAMLAAIVDRVGATLIR